MAAPGTTGSARPRAGRPQGCSRTPLRRNFLPAPPDPAPASRCVPAGWCGWFFSWPSCSPAGSTARDRRLPAVCLAAQPATLLPARKGVAFARRVALDTLHQIVEIDRVAVEVGAVDAGKPDASAHLDAAAAAHAGAVDHHGIEADHRLELVCARRLAAALHHERRPDRHRLINVGMALQRLTDSLGDEPLEAGRAVVGAQDQLVATGAELVLPEDQVAAAKTENANDGGPALFMRARLRVDRSDAEPAADAHDLFGLADVARDAHRPDHRVKPRATAALLLHLARGLAHRLDDQRDRAALTVEIGDGERDALAVRVGHNDDELARL